MSGEARLKFLIGDLWEEVLLFLAGQAGHKVEGQQDEVAIADVKGHRDAVIDGVTTDVKSASSYSFNRFENHLEPKDDTFGYLSQIQSYLEAGKDDPVVADKNRAAFLVGDKTLGKLTLDIHKKENKNWEAEVARKREMLAQPEPPKRCYPDEVDGASGNRKLSVPCSYCQFKKKCWDNLKAYAYSNGPRYLTVVFREPNVPRIF